MTSITIQLKASASQLWEAAVDHRFTRELGDGTLPQEKFRRYFLQDYVFIADLVKTASIAVAKGPDMDSARSMGGFLDGILGAEDALFLRAFENLAIPESEYRSVDPLPTTAAFGNFLVRLAYEGTFTEICCALYVTEGVYLGWADRLRARGASPGVPAYREWIEIHTDEALGPTVRFLESVVDDAAETELERLRKVFQRALRYELKFWMMSYEGESWPQTPHR